MIYTREEACKLQGIAELFIYQLTQVCKSHMPPTIVQVACTLVMVRSKTCYIVRNGLPPLPYGYRDTLHLWSQLMV